MPVITKISVQKRKKYFNIFLDNQYAFSVSEKILAEYRLLQGNELSPQDIKKVKDAESLNKINELAISYLSYQPRSQHEVLVYLKKHEIDDEQSLTAIDNLIELGYLDDNKFSELFVSNNLRVGKDGPIGIQRKLIQKGVLPEVIEDALYKFDDDQWLDSGLRLTHSLINQEGKLSFQEIKTKAKTKLLQHGFSGDLIEAIIQKLDITDDQDEQFNALKKQGIKAYRRYKDQDKYKKNQKIRRYLYQHGFSSNEISEFLNGEVIDFNDIDEY